MPIRRRGLRGGAEQGLGTLSQILASLLQNRMVGERQQELVETQNAAIGEREDARFDRQQALEEARARVAAQQARAKMEHDLNVQVARGEITPEQRQALLSGQGEGLAPQPTFTGTTGIGAQDAAGMNLSERQRALQASGVQEQPQINRILGRESGSGPAMPAPSHPGFAQVERQRELERGVEEDLAERDPRVVERDVDIARRTAEAGRRTPEQIEADAAAQARGTAAGTPAGGGTVTEGQRTAAAFYNTANQKREIIRGFNDRLFSDSAFATTQRILPNMLRSADMQSYLKILESIAFDITVGTSGAQFSANELQRRIDQITPEVGDRRETIEAKMAILESGLDALRQKAGGAVEPGETPPGDAGAGMSDDDLRELASSPEFTEADAALLTPEEQERLRRIRSGG